MTCLFGASLRRSCLSFFRASLCSTLCLLPLAGSASAETDYYAESPFGLDTRWAKDSDNAATGKWWEKEGLRKKDLKAAKWFRTLPREKAMAFALYTHHEGVLKMTGQCFPLLPKEPKSVVLELKRDGKWQKADEQAVVFPGWSVHFRVENWDATKDVPYRLKLGELSQFEGLIRKDPVDKDVIVVGSLNCNSPNDQEFDTRKQIVANLKKQNPDLLFFAGDQNYVHDEATFGWLQFGVQFAEIMKDRPTICIPDDHDVGHGNLWGAEGKQAKIGGASDGGYLHPAPFVNMVHRQQTSHLPDAYDPTPVKQGISVYYTDMTVGGVNFAILADRQFKTGPHGNIPKMGPRPDHINDPSYNRKDVDKPGLKLLGDRQLKFLDAWARDWNGAEVKAVLSQTAFCGAVHMHGSRDRRLLADLDCNGWPQTPRNTALRAIRRARATHLCGDQHLAVTVKHGIDSFRDGPFAFTAPAIVNTIYGRWWHPLEEKAGGGEKIDSPHPWVGDYLDGLGNKITMISYANPENRKDRAIRGDGYGLVRYEKSTDKVTFECWPRFCDISKGDSEQYAGWPITINNSQNDGRKPVGYLKEVELPVKDAVVELVNDETGELIYCYRVKGDRFKAPVFSKQKHTLRAGKDRAEKVLLQGVAAQ
ncbi:hypothetical protein HW115_18155 [Verrucomicrobiaceae bacterium N1E253]|uniref:PhoD-like phosphatase n=1 Tax=Oceaniferula marina TaxID=2748318 RepID=A0A851GRB8_9BACT|nr:hypothetical protein [Oceaniferula marina]NWK57547.1 hypothetical protein [Oceaniferula marina]